MEIYPLPKGSGKQRGSSVAHKNGDNVVGPTVKKKKVFFLRPVGIAVLAVVLITLIFGGMAYWVNHRTLQPATKPNETATTQTQQSTAAQYPTPPQLISEGSNSPQPAVIPKSFPWEKNAQVIGYYMQDISPTAAVIVKNYTSQKSLAANYSVFSKYFTNLGWKVIDQINTPSRRTFIARDPKMVYAIAMDFAANSNNQVTVTFTETFPVAPKSNR